MKKDSFKCKAFFPSHNKVLEFQLSRWGSSKIFDSSCWKRKKGKFDHHGLEITVTLFWHELRVDFYDRRHKEDFTKQNPKG